MRKDKVNRNIVLLIILLIISGCAPIQKSDYNALENWKASRPRVSLSKTKILKYFEDNYKNLNPIEGIWLYSSSYGFSFDIENAPQYSTGVSGTDKNSWKVAIIKKNKNPYDEQYLEVLYEILADNTGYKENDIGIILNYFQAGLYPNNYIREYPMGPKEAFPYVKRSKGVRIKNNIVYVVENFMLNDNNILHGSNNNNSSNSSNSQYQVEIEQEYLYVREKFTFQNSEDIKPIVKNIISGSGSIISESGLVVTNYHVIEDRSDILVYLPQINREFNADLILKDKNNDLAILKLQEFKFSEIFSNPIPFIVSTSSSSRLGEDVFTLGFPLGEILGKTSKFSSGKINSLFGIQDDPRVYQISNPIQPGNSGGPLFNSKGEFIGIVFSSLNAKLFFENADIIPQNVNFAIKSDYLLNLISLLPDEKEISNRKNSLSSLPIEKQIELIQPFIVNVKAR